MIGAWLRKSITLLDGDLMKEKYGEKHDYPRSISIETGSQEIENDPTNPPVNVVLYNDQDLLEERNDYYFEKMSDAILFCAWDYHVAEDSWITTEEWTVI